MGTFDEEWAAIQASARREVAAGGLLPARAPAEGTEDLGIEPDALRRAADYLENDLADEARDTVRPPAAELERAAGGVRGWETADGLVRLAESWTGKTDRLRDRLVADADIPRSAGTGLGALDQDIASQWHGGTRPWGV
ncbi:hypothetical protein [Streptomyces sp. RFCAC02]|uniref:hypothetical protein n=1 Tax=Streptomyces sp. RFCAC02 TaxID=2499143 RepID=UPI00101ED1A6|nr:hypothetical protein [Streptomyces sp. RFCAC02]